VSLSGRSTFSGGTFSVSGDGSDIWGSADSFHFVYQPFTGSGEITARVTSVENTSGYAKAGLMMRTTLDASSASVILDVKPDGGLEFMARQSDGSFTDFIAGGFVVKLPAYLRITRTAAGQSSLFEAWVLESGAASWTRVGSVTADIRSDALAGMAVTSHNPGVLNTSTFDAVTVVKNLLTRGDFEDYTVPALGPPGWISDRPLRQIDAVSDTTQPYTGLKHGLCSQPAGGDCGIYQDVVITESGNYVFTVWTAADRPGGLVGVNINGAGARSQPVAVTGVGSYQMNQVGFHAFAGDVVRVWMYSPSTPGFVAIDDASLVRYLGPT
jgi:hypothetical protein